MKRSLFPTVPFAMLLLFAPTTGCRLFMDIPDAPVVEGTCANGVLDPGETCDGTDLGAATCESEGFYGGTLACTGGCELDTAGCTGFCGDGALQVEEGETCDGTDLGGATCETLGFAGGTLACTDACVQDTLGCTGEQPVCGDDVIADTEVCDGTALGTETCETQGFYGGVLACATDCLGYDLTDCQAVGRCGDGVRQVEQGEACDVDVLSGHTCASFGCRSGALACAADCLGFDLSGCQTGHDEDGDGVDDNCDNCPSISNVQQRDTDADGLGDACEVSGNPEGLSQMAHFDPFTSESAMYTADGGTWVHAADEIQGTSALAGQYRFPMSFYLVNYGVETTFSLDSVDQANENWSGVFLAWKGTSGTTTHAFTCLFARDANEIQIWEYATTGGWTTRSQANISGLGQADQWRRVTAFISGATIRCAYEDESGQTAFTTWTKTMPAADEFEGPCGLRVYQETARFQSFVLYQ